MKRSFKFLIAALPALLVAQGLHAAQITLYEGEGFRGRAFTTTGRIDNFMRNGFNDRASSIIVDSGDWEVCEDLNYRGRCVLLHRGSYDSLRSLGLNDRVTSVRVADRRRSVGMDSPPPGIANYEYRRRPNERIYEVPVSSARAVYGPPNQRCWVERQQVEERGRANVGGAVAGAIIGGILGHQLGSGRGRDVGTAGGAVVGGVIGANAGRDRNTSERDVEHCSTQESGPPDYWDVRYEFRGQGHMVQMSAPPGRTILVNRNGEPRQ